MDPSLLPDNQHKLEQLTDHPDIDMHLLVQGHRIEDHLCSHGAAIASWASVTDIRPGQGPNGPAGSHGCGLAGSIMTAACWESWRVRPLRWPPTNREPNR